LAKDSNFAKIRNLDIERSASEKYDRLKKDTASILKGSDSAGVFVQAMALGYHEKQRKPIKDRYPVVNINGLTEEQEWLIKAIAIAESGSLDILQNPKGVLEIAQEYSNGGIDILHERIYRGASEYPKVLEEELQQLQPKPRSAETSPGVTDA
jgi:dnd system-associated protein 4